MKTGSVLTGIAIIAFGFMAGAATVRAEDKPDYVVKDGKVDKQTFNGWRRYTDACLRCHGPDGVGSSYAPALVDSLKVMKKEDVIGTIINGRINQRNGSENVMPAFGEVEDVVLYIDDIYGYLKARSDGVVTRGRPDRWDR